MSEGPLLLSDRISEDFRALETDCHRTELEQFEDADPWIIFFFVDNFQMVGVNVDRIVGSKNCHVQQ